MARTTRRPNQQKVLLADEPTGELDSSTAQEVFRDGKTSSETIRQAATDDQGATTLRVREYATLDRAGRVQLPREMTRRLGMRKRVELQEEPGHIGVWPDQAGPSD